MISVWHQTWSAHDQSLDQCMISQVISAWSITWSVHDLKKMIWWILLSVGLENMEEGEKIHAHCSQEWNTLNTYSARHTWGQMVNFRHRHTHSFSCFFSCYQNDLSGLLHVQTKLSFLAQNLLLTSNTRRIKSNLSLHHTGYLISISSSHLLVLVGLLLFQQLWSPC